jgi:hypothetical protein
MASLSTTTGNDVAMERKRPPRENDLSILI